ncbi:hypothetical protein AQUCO_01300549v1 [Aquilegia coerulea]|uniref:Uncharacterized protein n=1 Tax=Aquilegia coerulea TaxID=218851 RepID=A0A2G5E271_AQUCA|nr:hypothetical protein AQUCO_01300549v1 [Aquilegia coerulea]
MRFFREMGSSMQLCLTESTSSEELSVLIYVLYSYAYHFFYFCCTYSTYTTINIITLYDNVSYVKTTIWYCLKLIW